jgi:hypothetical protein
MAREIVVNTRDVFHESEHPWMGLLISVVEGLQTSSAVSYVP